MRSRHKDHVCREMHALTASLVYPCDKIEKSGDGDVGMHESGDIMLQVTGSIFKGPRSRRSRRRDP